MALPTFTMRDLLQAGVHFGHHARRWNPKMSSYIFGTRHNIHILDLQQTVPLLYRAMQTIQNVTAHGGRVLFVATKRAASEKIAEAARRCGQYYVNHRWLGGMMTNWKTVSQSIQRLKTLNKQLSEGNIGHTKKEQLFLIHDRDKLQKVLGGIQDMGGLPSLVVVIDTNREAIAVNEANKLKVPVIAILDSNSDPDGINYPVPGNDDAIRAINLYCDLFAGAALEGIQQEMEATKKDPGSAEEIPSEAVPEKELPQEVKEEEDSNILPPEKGALTGVITETGEQQTEGLRAENAANNSTEPAQDRQEKQEKKEQEAGDPLKDGEQKEES